ncbi:MAG TPA: tRNA (N(6)-L-threonylcarbamoyladenosine(37)-C(2))-methylthiotransferase MtaB [Geminicoccus sp.]|jgi:threonylcarbamoyladenosine tRNA methylthiotransferase MtaB|uniref:tRNA (N(6)-L-threonylcarbamoyladenosine(37)-C(2))- methylthiotransferase MtaB n=1 Tax=Geminicoccus sp. TaxID=2024832 RepID=UPI002E34A9FB|nr:tRNA (N(6)-L-threonylcarbamoyladenosine(37)-C(2))-methylthiotransferase MtaB [Geminicoccus sp.]HEX2527793.1 tRNA (N(6)-L-threonylcarbamoyladenosine(37)-C(2))-methylthiotransferase MtaB [Geminicoccus sp.]
MSEIDVLTFGCRLNSFESEVMRRHAEDAGLDELVIVHSCTVTAEAERQVRQAVRKARRTHPGRKIVVTGCAVQVDPARWTAMEEVDHVIGNEEKLKPLTWTNLAGDGPERAKVGDIMAVKAMAGHLVPGFDGRSRAFLQVQNGCDHRCTFCIIPFGRGPSRSVPVADVVAQTRLLAGQGYREVVVTGVDITSYGKDLEDAPTLGGLMKAVLRAVPELPRLRLSSIDPAEMDDDLLELIAGEPRLMPHLHLSLQAGDTLTLKRMKRRHSREDVLALTHRLRSLRPDLVFGADIIAGFPTETDGMFENTRRIVEEAGLTWLHVFPYSPRQNTPAARMPQVDPMLRKERAAILRAEGAAAVARFFASEQGRVRELLVERGGAGHTRHFAPVKLAANDDPQPGTLVDVRIAGVEGGVLVGERAA